jgi:integrase
MTFFEFGRIAETLSLRFEKQIFLDQEFPEYRWQVDQNKAGLEGRHFLHPALIKPMIELRELRRAQGTDLLFTQSKDKTKPMNEQKIPFEEWRAAANIGWHWTPHTFRHTCLSNLFNDSKNPQALICKLYRVSLPTAMEHYIKPTQEGTLKMREAISVDFAGSVAKW